MTDEPPEARTGNQKIWQILFIALVTIAFTAVWLGAYLFLDHLIWNDSVLSARWTIPAGILLFSLLTGLCVKYLQAPDVIHGGFSDSMQGEGAAPGYRTFYGTLLSSFFSLLSGASIGPEGSLAYLVRGIAAWFREKLAIPEESALGFDMAALASAYNGILGSPLFTAVFATEFRVGDKQALRFLAWNLIAGVIGFLFYTMLGLLSFARFLSFPLPGTINPAYILIAAVLGVLGAGMAVLMGVAMTGVGNIMGRLFGDRVLTRIFCAGVIIAVVCFFIPDLMFSGEASIHGIIRDPAGAGILMLLLMAVLKVLLLALSFKSGYLGGPIFPVVFSCTMVGLALALLFPGVPAGIFVLCIIAAVVTVALGVPLTAILLVAVMGAADQTMTVLLVISSAVSLLIGIAVRERQAERSAGMAAPSG